MKKPKSGFGLLEVMAAAVVLGFLIVGLTRLQLGNREAALRIRTRDAAQIVAQQFIDSLSSIGISSVENGYSDLVVKYKWEGKPSKSATGISTEIPYTINAKIAEADAETSIEESFLENTNHVRAKKVDLEVSWPFRGSTQSIKVLRIIK